MKIVPDIESYIPGTKDEITADAEAHQQREKVLRRQGINSLFFGMNQMFTFLTGILISVGVMFTGNAAREVLNAGGNAALSLGSIATADGGIIGLSLLGAAAATASLSIAAHQVSSRVLHAVSFDQSELNAQHTAKYIAQELRKEMEDLGSSNHQTIVQQVTYDNPARADGKPWSEHLKDQQAANQNVQQR